MGGGEQQSRASKHKHKLKHKLEPRSKVKHGADLHQQRCRDEERCWTCAEATGVGKSGRWWAQKAEGGEGGLDSSEEGSAGGVE